MLSFKDASGNSPVGARLQDVLKSFHKELMTHCGCVDSKSFSNMDLEETSVMERLKSLVQVVLADEEQCQKQSTGDRVTTLQQLITRSMISWANVEIHDPDLIVEIFLLLYRQYDEVHEVVQALGKTYVIDIANNNAGVSYDVAKFRQALGGLRLLVNIGMGKQEEELMRDCLRMLRNSTIFYCHPHLIRQLGVHSTVLQLMRSYLGISSGPGESQYLTLRRKQRLCMVCGSCYSSFTVFSTSTSLSSSEVCHLPLSPAASSCASLPRLARKTSGLSSHTSAISLSTPRSILVSGHGKLATCYYLLNSILNLYLHAIVLQHILI